MIHLVLYNLNMHFRRTFVDVLGEPAAAALLRRLEFHDTPEHATWLNMTDIEIGIMKGAMHRTAHRHGTRHHMEFHAPGRGS